MRRALKVGLPALVMACMDTIALNRCLKEGRKHWGGFLGSSNGACGMKLTYILYTPGGVVWCFFMLCRWCRVAAWLQGLLCVDKIECFIRTFSS